MASNPTPYGQKIIEAVLRNIGHDSCCSINDSYDMVRFGKVCDCDLKERVSGSILALCAAAQEPSPRMIGAGLIANTHEITGARDDEVTATSYPPV